MSVFSTVNWPFTLSLENHQGFYTQVSSKIYMGAFLVVQWLRVCLPMQGTRVRALGREDPTCSGATKPMRHNYWVCALELTRHNYWARVPQLLSLCATTTEAHAPRARALQQEKPPQWEARALQWRPNAAKNNKYINKFIKKINKTKFIWKVTGPRIVK